MVRLVEAVQFLCSNLPVSEEIKLSALILTTTLPNDALLPVTSTGKAVCFLYAATIEKRFASDNPISMLMSAEAILSESALSTVTLNDMLKCANIHIKEFFEYMKQYDELQSWSEAVHQHLAHLKKQYCISALMASKLSRLSTENEMELKRLTWNLYLELRDRLRCNDLTTSLSVLLSCFCLSVSYLQLAAGSSSCVDMLHCLGDSYQCQGELDATYGAVQELIHILPQSDGTLNAKVLAAEYEVNYRRMCGINELLLLEDDPTLVVVTCQQQESESDDRGPNKPGNDQQRNVCLTPVSKRLVKAMGSIQSVGGSSSETGDSAIIASFFQSQASDPLVELRKYLMTLRAKFVDAFVLANGQLMRQVAEQRFHLISRLYFSALESICLQCKPTMTTDEVAVLFNDTLFHGGLVACATLSVMVMYSQCSEDEPLSTDKIVAHLTWVLDAYLLDVVDVFKLLSLFIMSALPIMGDMQKQLQRIENYILSSMAWHENNKLWHLYADRILTQANSDTPSNASTNNSSHSVAQDSTIRSAVNSVVAPVSRDSAGFLSPAKRCRLLASPASCQSPAKSLANLQSPVKSQRQSPAKSFACLQSPVKSQQHLAASTHNDSQLKNDAVNFAPSASSTSGSTPSVSKLFCSPNKDDNTVGYLLSKVLHLVDLRISDLFKQLHITDDSFLQKVKKTVEYCVMFRGDLLKDRHIDIVIMCSVYAVSKVMELESQNNQEMTFRNIIRVYKQLPHDTDEIFKKVLITPGCHSCIITFYNQLFIGAMKHFLVQFASAKLPTTAAATVSEHNAASTLSSPLKSPSFILRGCPNFTISPMKQSAGNMTPRSRQFYCFGTPGSGEKLKLINESIKTAAGNTPKRNGSSTKRSIGDSFSLPLRDIDPSSTSRKQLKFEFSSH